MTEVQFSVSIPSHAANSFLASVRDVLASMEPEEVAELRLYVKGRDAIAISFDGELHPFLGRKTGLNREPERVHGLDENLFVPQLIRARLGSERPEGGRVFLTPTRVYWVDEEGTPNEGCEFPLIHWDWPGEDPVDAIRDLQKEYAGAQD